MSGTKGVLGQYSTYPTIGASFVLTLHFFTSSTGIRLSSFAVVLRYSKHVLFVAGHRFCSRFSLMLVKILCV